MLVSIPQWCDCCHIATVFYTETATRFNPTMVRLLLEWEYNGARGTVRFNPTMVRLLPIREPKAHSSRRGFNPTMVRLLRKEARVVLSVYDCFNPTMVRLLLFAWLGGIFAFLKVSIPQWCDCCAILSLCANLRKQVSIPQWCDCCLNCPVHNDPAKTAFQSHNGAIAAGKWCLMSQMEE